jgi:hypothetical protein
LDVNVKTQRKFIRLIFKSQNKVIKVIVWILKVINNQITLYLPNKMISFNNKYKMNTSLNYRINKPQISYNNRLQAKMYIKSKILIISNKLILIKI